MATVAGMTALSRVAGFARDILTAASLGAGPVGDAFFVALKLPNFFRRVTAEGAFSVSFVPLYSETLEKEGREQAEIFAGNAFSMMLLMLAAFTLLALIAMPFVIMVIAPGFEKDAMRYVLSVELSRITFPYLLMMSLTALLGGVLNAHDRFAPFAFAPVIFNLSLITALLLNGFAQTAGHAMAYGIFIAGVLQFLWLLINARRAGFRLRLVRPRFTGRIRKVFALMGPGVIGAGVMHINLFADLIIASLLPEGSISYLYYADRLNQLPLGVVGIAVGTALLPMLSRALAAGNNDEARNLFNRALEVCLLLGIPAAVALAIAPGEIISVLFQRGAFEPSDTIVTSYVLMGYALGMPAYICVKVLSSAYWARQDTKTPVKVSVIATAFNIVMSLTLINFIGVAGISVSTGIAGWVQFYLLKRWLDGDEVARTDERFRRNVPKIIFASVLFMGIGLIVIKTLLAGAFAGFHGLVPQIGALVLLVAGGMGIYGIAVFTTGVAGAKDIELFFKRKAHKARKE
jgi:putative peptidoglycan lipid II flippase